MVSGAFLLSSCSKEMAEPQNTAQMNLVPAQQGETQILEFLAVYENWKSNPEVTFNNMSKADAVWLMEASINYLNGFQLSYWENEVVQESNYNAILVEGNNDYFTGGSILSTFALMDAAITNQKANNNHNMVLVVDLYLDEENSNAIFIRSISALSYPISNISDKRLIESDDYWSAGFDLGKCDIYAGQEVGKDATDKVNYIVNWNWWNAYYRTTYNAQDVLYHTNVGTTYVGWGQTSGSDPWGGQPGNTCLSPTDMNGVLTLNENSIFSVIPNGQQLIRANVYWDVIGSSGPSGDVYHNSNNTHGIPHVQ